ncbi:MAG TPA: HAMP domain-containing sensor histidine kinase [Egibacteraceae bacterium]|nr:HAMP domain-containing sensor histidine kinase [Egibacteraceae bacterium]
MTTTEDGEGQSENGAGGLRRVLSSLRVRLVGGYLLLLALALAASIVTVRAVLLDRVSARIDRELLQEVEEMRALAAGRDPVTGEPFGDRVDRVVEVFLRRNIPHRHETMVAFVDGEPFLRSANPPPLRLDLQPELVERWSVLETTQRGQVDTEVGPVDYLAVPLRADGQARGVFVVAVFTALERAEVDEVVRLAGTVAFLTLAAGTVLAFALAGRVLQPVRQLTATAQRITDTDLSRRIDVRGHDELAELAATFNGMLDRLEGAFSGQRAFLDDAGHELRTPITIIRGHLELMGDDPAEREEVVALVLDELDRMHRIVDDLLLLAKAQRPDFLREEVIDVRALAEEVFAKAQALAPRDWRFEAVGDGRIVGDRHRLTQALVALAANAAAYTEEDVEVAIGAAVTDGHARLWVRDEGPGIPLGEQERIFDRFARGSHGQRSRDGSGLGLAIVRAVAEAHGGRVELRSRAGAGATFTVVIPVDRAGDGDGR